MGINVLKEIDVYLIQDEKRFYQIMSFLNYKKSYQISEHSKFYSNLNNDMHCMLIQDLPQTRIENTFDSVNINYDTNSYYGGFIYNKALFLFPIKFILHMKPHENPENIVSQLMDENLNKPEIIKVKFANMNIKNYSLKKMDEQKALKSDVTKHNFHSLEHLSKIKRKRHRLRFRDINNDSWGYLHENIEISKPKMQDHNFSLSQNLLGDYKSCDLDIKEMTENHVLALLKKVHILKYNNVKILIQKFLTLKKCNNIDFSELENILINYLLKIAHYICGYWILKSDILYVTNCPADCDIKPNVSLLAKQQKKLGIVAKKAVLWNYSKILKHIRDLILAIYQLSFDAARSFKFSKNNMQDFGITVLKVAELLYSDPDDVKVVISKLAILKGNKWVFPSRNTSFTKLTDDDIPEKYLEMAKRNWEEQKYQLYKELNQIYTQNEKGYFPCPVLDYFPNIRNITSFQAGNQIIQSIPLQALDFSSCNIALLCEGFLSSYLEIRLIDLSFNRLTSLPMNAFTNLPHLTVLLLKANFLKVFDSIIVAKNLKIECLILNSNPYEKIILAEKDIKNTQLHAIYLVNASLTYEQLEKMYMPVKLSEIAFSKNKLSVLPKSLEAIKQNIMQFAFNPWMCLHLNQLLYTLVIERGVMYEETEDLNCRLPPQLIGKNIPSSVTTLTAEASPNCFVAVPCDCSVNNPTTIYCSYTTFEYIQKNAQIESGKWNNPIYFEAIKFPEDDGPPDGFFSGQLYTSLSFIECGIQIVKSSMFANYSTKLKSISMASNNIHMLNEDSFKGCLILAALNLSNNNIHKELPFEVFSEAYVPKLETLDLSYNKLEIFRRVRLNPKLKDLYLTGNKLKTIAVEPFIKLTLLNTLDIEENFIKCDCYSQKLSEWLDVFYRRTRKSPPQTIILSPENEKKYGRDPKKNSVYSEKLVCHFQLYFEDMYYVELLKNNQTLMESCKLYKPNPLAERLALLGNDRKKLEWVSHLTLEDISQSSFKGDGGNKDEILAAHREAHNPISSSSQKIRLDETGSNPQDAPSVESTAGFGSHFNMRDPSFVYFILVPWLIILCISFIAIGFLVKTKNLSLSYKRVWEAKRILLAQEAQLVAWEDNVNRIALEGGNLEEAGLDPIVRKQMEEERKLKDEERARIMQMIGKPNYFDYDEFLMNAPAII